MKDKKNTCSLCGATENIIICHDQFPNIPDFCVCNTCLQTLKRTKPPLEIAFRITYDSLTNKDKAYIRKWYEHFGYLTKFFPEEKIYEAIVNHHFKREDGQLIDISLTEYLFVKYQNGMHYDRSSQFEYIKDEYHNMHKKDRWGNEYVKTENTLCRKYRKRYDYQHLQDGDIVLELLYNLRPELREFQYDAYSLSNTRDVSDYEIYPKNNIYTPFTALMNRDIEAIREHNMKYARIYNHGDFTPERVAKRLESKEAQRYFNVIRGETKTPKTPNNRFKIKKSKSERKKTVMNMNFEAAKSKLTLRLLSVKDREDWSDDLVHYQHPMGIIVPYIKIDGTFDDENESFYDESLYMEITPQTLSSWNVSKETLLQAALENYRKTNRVKLMDIDHMMSSIITQGLTENDDLDDTPLDSNKTYCLTNNKAFYGATFAIDPDILAKIRKKMGNDYYMLPSSVHEILIVSVSLDNPVCDLLNIVHNVNETMLTKEEYLSDDVYKYTYNETTKTGTIIPYKRTAAA